MASALAFEGSVWAQPVARTVDIIGAYRQIIVLMSDLERQDASVRAEAEMLARVLFHQNFVRIEGLVEELLPGRIESQPVPDTALISAWLDHVESNTAYRSADRLAVADVALELEQVRLPQGLALRVAGLRRELAATRTAYEKELDRVFGKFSPRGMPLRESWQSYISFLRDKYTREALLREYRDMGLAPAARGNLAPRPGTEFNGRELPPKTVLLTFDDGPHPRYTDRILAILARYNVPAVFFHVGQNLGTVKDGDRLVLGRNAEVTRHIVAAGNVLANHTYSHPVLPKLKQDEFNREIDTTARLLHEIQPEASALFRAPYGARDARVLGAIEGRKLTSMMWNIDSLDWSDPLPRSIADRVIRELENQKRGIVLFHDIQERTTEALPLVLEALTKQGFRFARWNGNSMVIADTESKTRSELQSSVAPGLGGSPYRESFALLIGIDQYKQWPRLRYAVSDAEALREVLVRKYGFKPQNVFTLYNEQATRQNILLLMSDKLADPNLVKRDDRVFIFYAGHGATRRLPSGRDLGYLIPAESDLSNYFGQAISMTALQDVSEAILAKHVLFVMDSCYSGLGITRGSSSPFALELTRRTARQMLTAGGADEQVADNGPNGHSIFTWTLLQALEGKGDLNRDGVITASELAAYTAPVVSQISRQTPAFGSLPGTEGGEFVFEIAPQNEFLSDLSRQLDDEAVALNDQINKLRDEIAQKAERNRRLREQFSSIQRSAVARAEATSIAPTPTDVPAVEIRSDSGADNFDAHNDRGMAFYKEKRYADALREFLAAHEKDPGLSLGTNNIGFIYFKLGDLEKSIEWLRKTIALDPKRAVAYLNLADALMQTNLQSEAKLHFEKYLELLPFGPAAARVRNTLNTLP